MAVFSTIILVLSVAGLVLCFFRARTNPAGVRALVIVLLVLTVLSGTLRACFRPRKRAQTLQGNYYAATAAELGKTVARELPGGGPIVVLQYNFRKEPSPVSQAQIEGLKAGFGETKITIAAIEPALREYPAELSLVPTESAMPENLFFDSLAKHPEARAVVSFTGMPFNVRTGRPSRAKAGLPPLFLFASDRLASWSAWMRNGTLKAVVMPKKGMEQGVLTQAANKTASEIFAATSMLVTAENLDSVLRELEQE